MTFWQCSKLISIIPFITIFLVGCSSVTPGKIEGTGPVLWLSNASPVDFSDLDELDEDLYELHGDLYKVHFKDKKYKYMKKLRYEGFYDQYHEEAYTIPRDLQPGTCLSPETEWMIYFPPDTQKEIAALLNDISSLDEKALNDKIRNLKVELRGMIEGKWLDVLKDESRHPAWIKASGHNNVVSVSLKGGQRAISVKELDQTLLRKKKLTDHNLPGKMEVYRVPIGMDPSGDDTPLYYSDLHDLTSSDLLQPILDNDQEAVLSLVKVVLRDFSTALPDGSESHLVGINFSAQGDNAALVSNPDRRTVAEEAIGKKIIYFIRYFFPMNNKPRVGMRIITEEAIAEINEAGKRVNCLEQGEEYVLYLYDTKNEPIGEARLKLEEE